MADQRQPFRFRLPWMPPTPTPTPAPASTPAPPPRQPAAAPPRPPFRPGGVAPTQPQPRTTPPRVNPPPPPPPPPPTRASEQASPPKPASPPKTEPPSKPVAPTPSPPKTEPPSKPIASTPSPPMTEPPSKPIASTPSPPKTEPPSKPVASTPSPPKTEPPSKPIASTPSPPKTEPPSKPIASTPSSPKIEPPSKPIASTSSPPKTSPPTSSVSTPKEAKAATSRPISPKQPPTQKSPSGSPSRPKPSSPSSSFPPSPREKALKEPHDSPKREPSPTLKYPNSPTILDQGSSSKKEPEKLQAQQQQATIASEIASDNGKPPHSSPKPIQKPVTSISDKEEPKEEKRVIDESIIKQNGEPRKKEIVTEVPESETVLQPVSVERISYPKVSKPHGNHKTAWEKAPLQKEIKEDISKFVHKLGVGQGKQNLDGEKQLTVITLAGENRGASMTLSNEPRQKESSIHIHRGYRANPDEAIENSTDKEEKNSKTDEETTTKAYINSNVQGLNNSLLFNGSVSTMNPGVRYVRYNNLKEGSKVRRHDQAGSFETNKAEFSGTQSEMMAYAPNVRRRCLRGLLMESSDSDPEKPRRHGCRYECKDKNKDVDVL